MDNLKLWSKHIGFSPMSTPQNAVPLTQDELKTLVGQAA
jgi:hypothetical protein